MALRHDDVEQVDRLTEDLLHTRAPGPSRDGAVDVTRDRILVERCQAGDRAAFDELYLRYQRRLYRFCLQRVGQAHDAEDVVQESFVRAWRALPRFAGERRFYPWLTVIAANLCVDTLRRRSRLTPVEESRITAADTGTYDIEDGILHEVDSKMVATAFGQLSTRHQRVLQMREGSEWSYRKIAEHEGVGVTAVETLLWRARQALKREFLILDEQRGKIGALIGFLVVFPARAVARLPKAMKHGVSHAVEGTRNAVGTLGSGAFGDFGTGALGVFGPSVAAATGAVAITVGTVLMLPTGGPAVECRTLEPGTDHHRVAGPGITHRQCRHVGAQGSDDGLRDDGYGVHQDGHRIGCSRKRSDLFNWIECCTRDPSVWVSSASAPSSEAWRGRSGTGRDQQSGLGHRRPGGWGDQRCRVGGQGVGRDRRPRRRTDCRRCREDGRRRHLRSGYRCG